jgi:transposase
MKLLYRCCAGLDIHRDTVSACIRRRVAGKSDPVLAEEVFGTFTQELERLCQWLKKYKVKQVAMESTGVYWIPVWNVLEDKFLLTLVNPATVRALQGNKTDRIDARRIAEYLQYGLLRGSFIPCKPIRELRELTRMRVHVQQDRNRVINRMARLLETVNLKLASVASNIVGVSGLDMLRLLAQGESNPYRLAECARGRMQSKIPALVLALEGRPDEHFRWKLAELLRKLEWLDKERARLDARIDLLAAPYQDALQRLATIPGVDQTAALVLLAEFGTDMSQFPTPGHLASWAGLCPGNAESAGKRFSGRTRKGDRYVRRVLVQSAWAASRANDCFLAALFFRTAQRRGLKKAAVAVAHRLLVIAWHILAESGAVYHERGGDHFDRRDPERTARRLTRRLENIGYTVTLTRPPQPTGLPDGGRKFIRPAAGVSRVDPAVCRRCARRKLSKCICLLKRKPHNQTSDSATLSTT